MNDVTGKKIRTVSILLAAIAAIWFAGYGLFISSTTTAGTDEARLSRAEFISKADRICNRYYMQASPIVGREGRTPAAQASIFKGVKPYLDDSIQRLKQLRPPVVGEQTVAQYISSLEGSSSLIDRIEDSAGHQDLHGFRTYSQEALKKALHQKAVAASYGFKVCSRQNATSNGTRGKSPMLLSRAVENV